MPEEEGRALLRRRLLLKALAASAGTFALPPLQLPAFAAVRDRAAVKVVASQVDHDAPALISETVGAGQLFDRIAVHVRSLAAPAIEIRTSGDGALWSEWRALAMDPCLFDPITSTHYASPIAVDESSRYAQYRISGDVARLSLTFMDVSELNASVITRAIGGVARFLTGSGGGTIGAGYAMAAPTGAPKILSRQDWSADESLMKWAPKYVPWQKAVLHHTVTDDGGSNVAASIRSIYYYHAVTRGWGDIGYNFVVDKFGNIWTGRQGGDNVVAGHAYGWNDGTLGVAALGDYTSVAPTGQLQGAFANVVALKMKQLGVAPYGSSAFTHEEQQRDGSWVKVTTTVANVLGHRDCNYIFGQTGGQTACPGNSLYPILGGLRSQAQSAWQNGYTYLAKLDPQLPAGGTAGQTYAVPVLVTNVGTVTIPAGTLVNYRVLRDGNLVTQGSGTALAQPVAPGTSASATVAFGAPPLGNYVIRWDLATGSAWWSSVYGSPVRDQWFRSADWSANWIDDNVPRAWTAGEIKMISVTVQNDGGRTWPAGGTNPVRLGYYWINGDSGQRIEGTTKLPLPSDVVPGQTISLTLPIVAPLYPASYTMVLDLYKENEFWFKDKGLSPDDTPTNVALDAKASYTLPAQLPAFEAGKAVTIPLTITNLGRGVFPAAGTFPVDLGYHWSDPSGKTIVWDGARTKFPIDLAPGTSVNVPATVIAPTNGGAFALKFDLVQEGVGWFSGMGVTPAVAAVNVAGPVVASYGASYQPGVTSFAVPGAVAAIPFTVVNGSNFTWSPAGANPVNLAYHWLDSAGNVIVWEGARTKMPSDVAPGASAALQAQVVFPTAQGKYTLRWDLVQEGVTWFSGKGVKPLDQIVTVGPAPFYGGSLDVSKVPANMPTRLQITVPLRVQNLSNFAWGSDVNLSYHWYDGSGKVVMWDGARTPLAGIAPNDLRAVDATVVGPMNPGAYTLRFDIVHEGVTWFSDQGMQLAPLAITVAVPPYAALYASPLQISGAPNAGVVVPVTLTNTGAQTWQPGTINLAYHLYSQAGAVLVWDGARTPLAAPLAPGASVTLNALIKFPGAAGAYTLKWDLVQEGVAWFSSQNVPMGSASLVAQ